MAAPSVIIDALESVISIYFSGVRHRERSAYILCDNLVEMTCKVKAKEYNYRFNMSCSFFDALSAQGVNFATTPLGRRVLAHRENRNNMQHAGIAITVDMYHCADAILDAVKVIDRLWANTSKRQFPGWLQCCLRVLKLYSSDGQVSKREQFEQKMRQTRWEDRASRPTLRVSAIPIEPGHRDHWWHAFRIYTSSVEEHLNELEL